MFGRAVRHGAGGVLGGDLFCWRNVFFLLGGTVFAAGRRPCFRAHHQSGRLARRDGRRRPRASSSPTMRAPCSPSFARIVILAVLIVGCVRMCVRSLLSRRPSSAVPDWSFSAVADRGDIRGRAALLYVSAVGPLVNLFWDSAASPSSAVACACIAVSHPGHGGGSVGLRPSP